MGDDMIHDFQTHLMEVGRRAFQISNFFRGEAVTRVLSPIGNRLTVKSHACGIQTR
jgi:hypothetical protein